MDWSEIGWGTLAGACTGLATLIGALPILLRRNGTRGQQQGVLLGFAAGVMLSASYLSLIVPAAYFARSSGHGPFAAAGIVALSVLAGASLHWLKRWEPFERSVMTDPTVSPALGRRAWLLTLAMTTHNLPEGAAVGVGFAAGDPRIAISTAVGIGIQNLPEGLAVAAAMLSIGRNPRSAIIIAGMTGLVEPVGAFLGVTLVSAVSGFLPVGMGWAAGAMLYICAAELIPAVHDDARTTNRALTAVVIGISSMLFLDTALSA